VVFTTEGSLWRAPMAGGTALRLTRFPGRQGFAQLSPDGTMVAFTSGYQGTEDVWVMPLAGGEPRRLTRHPAPDVVIGWSPDGSAVLFRSARSSPVREPHGFSVPAAGGEPAPLALGPLARLSHSPDGRRIALGRYSLEFHRWKRYLGGWAQEIWVGNADGTGFARVTTYGGMNAFPMWHGDRIYFVSDRDGVANVFSMQPDGRDLRQHTHHTDFGVRWPSLGDGQMVYTVGADLWSLDVATGAERPIDVTTATDRSGRQVRHVQASHNLTDFDVSPDGRRILVGARGQTCLVPVKEGRTIPLGTSGCRQRSPRYSPDGKWIGCFSDASEGASEGEGGEEMFTLLPLEKARSARRFEETRHGFHRTPVFSPDGARVAFGDQTLALNVVDVKTGTVTRVDRSPAREIVDYAWSPDSRWLVYARAEENHYRALHLHDTRTGSVTRLTEAANDDRSPCFDREGKYIYFISHRHLDPIVGNVDFEAIFEPTNQLYAIMLRKGGRSPITPRQPEEEAAEEAAARKKARARDRAKRRGKDEDAAKEGPGARAGSDAGAASASAPASAPAGETDAASREGAGGSEPAKDAGSKPPPRVEIDLEGIGARVEELPVAPGWYEALSASAGRLFYLSRPVKGLLARDFFASDQDPIWTLKAFDLKRRREETWAHPVHGYELAADTRKLVYRGRDFFRVVPTDQKPRGEEEERDKDDSEKGIVRLRNLTLRVDPVAEWRQMLREAWRRQRDFFFDPGLGGVDWNEAWRRYSALLDRISTREELSDLVGEMFSELSTSHTYVWGGETGEPRAPPVGMLGADLEPAPEGGVRVARLLRGRDWSERARSPLGLPHVDVGPGSRIVGIEGQRVDLPEALHELLQVKAGLEVLLNVAGPGKRRVRDVIVRCMRPAEEADLRYLDWVERNRRHVDEATGGRVGYLHVPDMGGRGLSEFSRALYPQIRKKGLVVDIRYNGGGFVSQLLVARLARRLWAFMQPRHGLVETYPSRVFHGPFAVLTNHAAGSDGDIFAESVKLMGLAPVVGTRSWGGVVGLNEVYRMVDGGIVTVPAVAWWDPRSGWDLENRGVEPDHPVENTPSDWAAGGRDAQLDRAIQVVCDRLDRERWDWPAPPPYPDKSLRSFRARARAMDRA
jgi:tricorn protease